MSDGQETVDMRAVCEGDASENQATTVYRRKWAAKQECEELKGGVWLDPVQALMKRGQTSTVM